MMHVGGADGRLSFSQPCCEFPETEVDATVSTPSRVDFRTEPARYRHWKLSVEGRSRPG
jgi:hypothetical protein